MSHIEGDLIERSKTEIVNLLKCISVNKILLIDTSLEHSLNVAFGFKSDLLKSIGVSGIHCISSIVLDPNDSTIIYITRPNRANIDIIMNQMRAYPKADYIIYFVPRITLLVKDLFERGGTYCKFGEIRYVKFITDERCIEYEFTNEFNDI